MTTLERDFIKENFLDELAELGRRLDVLERLAISTGAADDRYLRRVTSYADVTNPPTLAELEEAFGAAATLPNGYIAILDDNAAGTDVYLCCVINGKWWIEILTVAT